MALVPETRALFGTMSVEDNLLLGAYRQVRLGHKDSAKSLDEVFMLFPRLRERRAQLAGTLSGGERQMLAVGRALMGKPRLLMLDEPSLGLAPLVVRDIFATIAALRATGVTILLVEQNARAALEVADYGYVLEMGEIALEGPAEDLAQRPARDRDLPRRDAEEVGRLTGADAGRRRSSGRRCRRGHGPARSIPRSRSSRQAAAARRGREPEAIEQALLLRFGRIVELGARVQRRVVAEDLQVARLEPHRVHELGPAHDRVEQLHRLALSGVIRHAPVDPVAVLDAVAVPLAEQLAAFEGDDRDLRERASPGGCSFWWLNGYGACNAAGEVGPLGDELAVGGDRAAAQAVAAARRLVVAAEQDDVAAVDVEVELGVRRVAAAAGAAVDGTDILDPVDVARQLVLRPRVPRCRPIAHVRSSNSSALRPCAAGP
jgi:ABC-type multidrug transport system ATPase subunit